MSTYELAKAILPHLINTEYSPNPHSMARRAFDYAKAFEDVTPEYEPTLGTVDFGVTDEFPMWDDLGMNLGADPVSDFSVPQIVNLGDFDVTVDFSGVTSGCLDNMNNFWQDDIIKTESVLPEYVVNGNVDLTGVNISLNPIR